MRLVPVQGRLCGAGEGTEKEREGAIKKKGVGKENKKGLSAKLLFFF